MKTRNSAAMLLFALMAFTVLIGETKAARMKRIIGGEPASSNRFSYTVSITALGSDTHLCNGAIIGSRHIITSATCLPRFSKVAIRSGKYSFLDNSVGKTTVEKDRHPHPSYNSSLGPVQHGYDVAIVELVEALVIDNVNTKIVPLACTPPVQMAVYTVSGFGGIKLGQKLMLKDQILRTAFVQLLDNKACWARGGNPDYGEKLCAIGWENKKVDLGDGDCGAPLVNSAGELVGTGICSLNRANTPHFYAKVSIICEWISAIMMRPSIKTYSIDSQKSARPGPSKARG